MMEEEILKQILETQKKILEEVDALQYGDADEKPTLGQRLADAVVHFIGSWRFIIIQSIILTIWIVMNGIWLLAGQAWDPYPFILLNLMLSFQAAYASPLILMAQNRSDMKDRRRAQEAYRSIERIERMLYSLGNVVKAIKEKNNNGSRGTIKK